MTPTAPLNGRLRLLTAATLAGLLGFTAFLLAAAAPAFLVEVPSSSLARLSAASVKGGTAVGYKLAYLGAVLLVLAQAYSFRVRFPSRRRAGLIPASEWLKVHIYLGLAGSALILIHSGFPFSFTYAEFWRHFYPGYGLVGLLGAQGMAAWLTLAVVVSGLVGLALHRRPQTRTTRNFRRWIRLHVALTGALYVSGMVHIVLVVLLKHTAAI